VTDDSFDSYLKEEFTTDVYLNDVFYFDSYFDYIDTGIEIVTITTSVNNFVPDKTWFIKFADYITLNISEMNTNKDLSIEFIDTWRTELSDMILSQNLNLEFIDTNKFEAILSFLQSMGNLEFNQSSIMRIVSVLNQIINFQTVYINTNMELEFDCNQLYYLTQWDSELLSTLDSMTLSEMEYTTT